MQDHLFIITFRRFLDKMGRTGTPLQFINGIFLLSTFAVTRLYYGTRIVRNTYVGRLFGSNVPATSQSIAFYQTLYYNYHRIPDSLLLIYGIGNIILNGLNWFWCVISFSDSSSMPYINL